MTQSKMPNLPGSEVVADTLDFVKNLWGSMSIPGMNIPGISAPTLSVDELDKKINDLKAVEAWLNLNMSMLRGSIQALEVQRGTIATLKSMGASFAAAVKQPGANEKSLFESVPYASAFFQQPAAPEAQAAPAPTPAPALKEPVAQDSAPAPDAAAQLANPAAWWNLVQDQFKQAVTTAMASDAVANATAMATDAAAKFAAASQPLATAAGKVVDKAVAAKPAAAKPRASKASKS